jgi:hypothetical protein
MNESPDPLERELFALRPQGLSTEVRQRIGDRLAQSLSRPFRRLSGYLLVGGLAAACVAVAICLSFLNRGTPNGKRSVDASNVATSVTEARETSPTVWRYQLALARSPDAIDTVLDRQSKSALDPGDPLVRVSAFTRTPSTLHALLGDDE